MNGPEDLCRVCSSKFGPPSRTSKSWVTCFCEKNKNHAAWYAVVPSGSKSWVPRASYHIPPPTSPKCFSGFNSIAQPSDIFQHFPVSVQVLQMGVTWSNMGQHSFIDTSCCITPYSISWNWAPKVQHRTGIRSVEDLERNGYNPHFYFVEPSSAASAPSIPQAEPPAQGHPIPIPTGLSSPDKEAHCNDQEIILV